jgi:uncharacterized protein YerC
MKKKKNEVNQSISQQTRKILVQVLANTKGEHEMESLLLSLMSEAELANLDRRLAIAVFLDKGQSYERIKDVLKVSSATIASVSEKMNDRGMQQALNQVKAEEWADMWSIKLSRALEKLIKK